MFAKSLQAADAREPIHVSVRSGRAYQPGIGPHSENEAVRLALLEATASVPALRAGQFVPYPGAPRQKCDVWIGDPVEWAIEVKMARLRGDNGKPDDTAIKDILSPYGRDRSALTDCLKLAGSGFPSRLAGLIYGFDYDDQSLEPLIDAFETLASRPVRLGQRFEATTGTLIHPVHFGGRVFGWEIQPAVGI
jgi:hypothetical protein